MMGLLDKIGTFLRSDSAGSTGNATGPGYSGLGGGWVNVNSGMGLECTDKSATTDFVRGADFTLLEEVCRDLYRWDWAVKKAIDLPLSEMLTPGWEMNLPEDDENALETTASVKNYLAKIPVRYGSHISRGYENAWRTAQRAADLFGGSILVTHVRDNQDITTPLDLELVEGIHSYSVYNWHRVTITNWESDPGSDRFGLPTLLFISPSGNTGLVEEDFEIHATRVQFFSGHEVDPLSQAEHEGWGDSLLNIYWDPISRLRAGRVNSSNLLYEMGVALFKMSGISSMLDAEGQSELMQRFGLANLTKSSFRALVMDAEYENVEYMTPQLNGLDAIMNIQNQDLTAATGIPMTKWWGISPGGLNSTGESDLENYHAMLSARRQNQFEPHHIEQISLAMTASQGPTDGAVPEEWSVNYLPYEQPTQEENSERHKRNAETVQILIGSGVISADEAREGLKEVSFVTLLNESAPGPGSLDNGAGSDNIGS